MNTGLVVIILLLVLSFLGIPIYIALGICGHHRWYRRTGPG